ncbi:lysozyme 3 [Strongylocentrotus purpuratus]|uniref:lysozyme n=1 Tax=Strongylocentrotus purpuratus TaxID=7668 RepID=A0A7M7TGP5_STRPU|nr:lysozyme 3 [Strongylocentrotus purpuratus]|eukprot:XP_788357.1 PREDICTED: lysozyme 3 [Strongylocentrotus purpuratus]
MAVVITNVLIFCAVFVAALGTEKYHVALPTPVPADCLRCICIVESNCKMPAPVCQMDVGSLLCGPYQITGDEWNDARMKGGDLMGSWRKCTADMGCSGETIQGYMARFAVISRLEHEPTCEDFARIHNGGPNGYNRTSTLKYWSRVKECLN